VLVKGIQVCIDMLQGPSSGARRRVGERGPAVSTCCRGRPYARGGAQASEGRLPAALREEVAAAEARAEEERAAAADARRAAARREHELEVRALRDCVGAPALRPLCCFVGLDMCLIDIGLLKMGCVREGSCRAARAWGASARSLLHAWQAALA